jgi:hypothetical protein
MRYFKEATLDKLRASVEKNLALYRNGEFSDFVVPVDEVSRPLAGEFDEDVLRNLNSPTHDELFDAENSLLLFDAFKLLTPLQAREERIWAYECHTRCLDYVRNRWPIPENDERAVKHIQTHFFAPTLRAIERDNGLSRLWWMGMIASRAEGITRENALKILMFRTDVRANLIERPTTSAGINVFSAVLKKLKESYDGKRILYQREVNRRFMKEINSIGGVKLLDSLSAEMLDNLMDEIVTNRLGLAEV